MRIGTWNLERPTHRSRRLTGISEQLEVLSLDVVVLTETHAAVSAPRDYSVARTTPSPRKPRDGEAVAEIWSRYPISRRVATGDEREAVCVEVSAPSGSLLVYGSIIPYLGYRRRGDEWPAAHEAAIEWQGRDWARLREEFPDHGLVVAGDFNQTRDGSRRAGSGAGRSLLTEALSAADLSCLTEENFAESRGLSRANIDHICASPDLAARVEVVEVWEGTDDGGQRLSDHNGVLVEFSPFPA